MTDSTRSGPPGAVGRVTRRSLLAGAGVAPTGVRTAMVLNEATYRWAGGTGPEDLERALRSCNTQPVGLIEPEDVAGAITFLVSPNARYISGTVLDVTAGASTRWSS